MSELTIKRMRILARGARKHAALANHSIVVAQVAARAGDRSLADALIEQILSYRVEILVHRAQLGALIAMNREMYLDERCS